MRVWLIAAAVASIFASLAASAHVTVWPRESRAGAHEKYTVRVPTERDVATSSVELQIPEGVTVVSMGTPAGYTYELKKAGDRVVSIVWTMRINPGEFAEFAFVARNPKDAESLTWKAIQHFVDGSTTEWTGPPGDKHPASVTMLVARPAQHAH